MIGTPEDLTPFEKREAERRMDEMMARAWKTDWCPDCNDKAKICKDVDCTCPDEMCAESREMLRAKK